MESILALWLPILAAAVLVFIASAILQMVVGHHKHDWSSAPDEEAYRRAVGPLAIPPGNYMVPRCGSMKEMGSPEYLAKLEQGPVAMITVLPNARPTMGKQLGLWFLHCVLVSAFAAWVVAAIPAGADGARAFCVAAVVAFAGYGLGEIPEAIWYARKWATVCRYLFDALVYALLTGAAFGWLAAAA